MAYPIGCNGAGIQSNVIISGISDLYVHVAVNNIPAKNLYMKTGFIFESDEPAWQARFMDRPRRVLLWAGLPVSYEL